MADRIKLGGQTVLSADSLPGGIDSLPAQNAETRVEADWSEFLQAAKLNKIERACFNAHWIEEIPVASLHQRLGSTPRQARRIYDRVREKIQYTPAGLLKLSVEPVRHSLRPVSLDRLSCGKRAWSLTRMDPRFEQIMLYEKWHGILKENDNRATFEGDRAYPGGKPVLVQARIAGSHRMTVEQLEKALAGERKELDRIVRHWQKAEESLRKASAELHAGQRELRADQVQAVIENRTSPTEQLRKKLAALQNEVHHLTTEAENANAARDLKSTKVAEIIAELDVRALERFRAKLSDPAAELLRLIRLGVQLSGDVQTLARESAIEPVVLAREIFPHLNPGSTESMFTIQVVNAFLQLQPFLQSAAAA